MKGEPLGIFHVDLSIKRTPASVARTNRCRRRALNYKFRREALKTIQSVHLNRNVVGVFLLKDGTDFFEGSITVGTLSLGKESFYNYDYSYN